MSSLDKRNDDISPATLDVNTENDDFHDPLMAPHSSQRRDRRNKNGDESAPLLNQERRLSINTTHDDIFGDDEEEEAGLLASPPAVDANKRKNYCPTFLLRANKPQVQQNEKGRATFFCLKRKTCLITCMTVIFLPIVAFVIFCSVYFSPASLPTNKIPLDEVALVQQNAIKSMPRLLTFNIFMRPPGIKNNEDDFKSERLDYIMQNILPSYDIITIQEAFAYANRRIDKLLAAAFKQGFYYHVSSARHYPWDLAGDGGLLILSRYPIAKSDRIEFPRGVHADWLSFKGALHALVEIDTKHYIHVYTTHTQASYDNAGAINVDDTKVRLSQFADVHQFIADTAKDDTFPILLMGDLNVDAAAHDSPINVPSKNSSLAYTMMVDVLTGKGTNLELIEKKNNNNNGAASNETIISYSSDWRLDNLIDMAYSTFGYHPVTFGDYKKLNNGTLVPGETVLTHRNQLMTVQSIDRVFWSNDKNNTMSLGNVTVEPFFVKNGTNLPFTQLSDHYGLSALLYL